MNIYEDLKKKGIEIGDRIRVISDGEEIYGVLMPRYSIYEGKNILVIKLDNGYNIGISVNDKTKIDLVSKKEILKVEEKISLSKDKPLVSILSTGGTIASRVDYKTGAVYPSLSAEDLIKMIPEIKDVVSLDIRKIMNKFSENMTKKDWEIISKEVYNEIKKDNGVIVLHGTDTMSYTSSALAFSIRNKNVPIIFVGSQRSSDRPSTDSYFNIKSAIVVSLKANFAESVVVMHGETSDSYSLVHRGVKVRKMHTSRRDAFQSINDYPIAKVYPDKFEIEIIGKIINYRSDKDPILMNKFEEKVGLIKFYPGFDINILDYFIERKYKGLVIEGTGLGHVSEEIIPKIKELVDNGIIVTMTSQCLFGRINMNVYSTGRLLLKSGVLPSSDMLPEVAYVKLSWLLGNFNEEEVKELYLKNLEGEINERLSLDMYPKWIINQ
ncbi:MAG: Glu-tRNA(Gln) amidotransferase subunit GatD [Nanopusillaceae archaeon]